MDRRKRIYDVDSIEFRLFDKQGKPIFEWKKVPRNIKTAQEILRLKGIKI